MALTAAEWLRATMQEHATWWRLSPGHFQMAIWLVAACEMRDGAPRLTATVDDLARFHRMSRMKIRRALDAMEQAGFCRILGQRGRGGLTQIVLCDTRPFKSRTSPDLLQAGTTKEIRRIGDGSAPNNGHTIDHSGKSSKTGSATIKPTIYDMSQVPETTDPSYLDLLRISEDPDLGSDLRSSDLEILSGYIPTQGQEKFDMEGSLSTDAERPISSPTEPTSPGKPRRRRIDPSTIPERAWSAADYLRRQTLAKNAAAVAGVKPWEYGWSWETGKAARLGDGSRTGLRLSWANSFRIFHEVLRGALKLGGKPSTDDYAWEEIAKTVHWLFHKQPSGVGFQVECPDGLRAKWDRIQSVRLSSVKRPNGYGAGQHAQSVRPAVAVADNEPRVSLFAVRKP